MTANKLRSALAAALLGTAAIAGAAALLSVPAMAANVRPEVGTPLQEAQKLAASGNYKAAMAKVNEAESVPGKTADESDIIAKMKSFVGVKSGDASLGGLAAAKAKFGNDYAARNYSAVIAAGDTLKSLGGLGTSEKQVIAQSYYLNKNAAGCVKYIKANLTSPDDTTLELLNRCAYDANDEDTQRQALETLVSHSGKTENWNSLLKLSERSKGMNDHQTLNIYRLENNTGTIAGKDEYTTLAQLAIQLKLPAEAQAVVEKGAAAGVLNDARSQRLLALAKTQAAAQKGGLAAAAAAAAKDPNGDALIQVAEQQLTQGDAAGAVASATAAQAKAKDKDNAAMVLGQAQLAAGKKAEAAKTFNSIKSTPNATMIAHLYALYSAKAPAVAAPKAPAKKG